MSAAVDTAAISAMLREGLGLSRPERRDRRLRQGDIARRFGVTQAYVSCIARGEPVPTGNKIIVHERSTTVERALGEGRPSKCPCGAMLEFSSDLLIGRVSEYCPRGCGTPVALSP